MAAAKEDGEKKGRSAINEVMTREYTTNIHKRIHGVGSKKHAPWALKEIQTFARKEMGAPYVHIDTRLKKAVWAKGIRNVPHRVWVQLSRIHNEDEHYQRSSLYVGHLHTCHYFQKSINS